METKTENLILIELQEIKQELGFIKKHMVDVDTVLTPKESKRLDLSLKEYKEKKTISLDNLKKSMGA